MQTYETAEPLPKGKWTLFNTPTVSGETNNMRGPGLYRLANCQLPIASRALPSPKMGRPPRMSQDGFKRVLDRRNRISDISRRRPRLRKA